MTNLIIILKAIKKIIDAYNQTILRITFMTHQILLYSFYFIFLFYIFFLFFFSLFCPLAVLTFKIFLPLKWNASSNDATHPRINYTSRKKPPLSLLPLRFILWVQRRHDRVQHYRASPTLKMAGRRGGPTTIGGARKARRPGVFSWRTKRGWVKREKSSRRLDCTGSTEKAAGVGWMDFQPRIDNNCLNQALVEAALPPSPSRPENGGEREGGGGGGLENEAKDKGASRSSNRAEHGVSTSPRWRYATTSIQRRLP